jgi:hypothetical protein
MRASLAGRACSASILVRAGRRSAGLKFGLDIFGRGRYPGIVRRQSKQPRDRPRNNPPRAAVLRMFGSLVGGLLDFEELAKRRVGDHADMTDFNEF